MRRLDFFPTPYPDECLYSIFCRYFVRSGSTSNKKTVFELFGEAQSLASFVYLPRRLELVEEWAGTGSLITRECLADSNSCYGYFSIAFTERMLREMEEKIVTGGSNRSLERQMIQKCRRSHWPEYLRYCPECTKEDIESFGEAYWHRLPQLPGVEYCSKHGKAIQNSSVHLKETTMRFLPASHALCRLDGKEEPERRLYKGKYLMIAKDSEWLLANGRRLNGCREVARKYKELFMEKGLTTAQGIRYTERIKSEFIKYHGEDFLNQLFPAGKDPLYWLEFAFVSVSEHLRPLHHILLMEFLKGSAEGFYKAVPDNEPYGNGPWPCINKLCRHYGKDGAEKISVSYLNGQTIGQFHCAECGMKYQRSRPWQTFEEYAGHAMKLDYGHLWYDKLRKCILEDKLCPSDVAKVMKSTKKTVANRAAEIGLDINDNSRTRIFNNSGKRVSADEYYHEKVSEILRSHSELTAKELNELLPGAYAWFSKNDFQWLKERLVTDREKRYWVEWEQKQLENLKDAYSTIQKEGDPNRRVTIGWLCTVAGLRESEIKGRLHRFEDIRAFIGEVVESKEEWLERRFSGIAERKRMHGEKMSLDDVRREMSLKPNTYLKHRVFIEMLIKELNGDKQNESN